MALTQWHSHSAQRISPGTNQMTFMPAFEKFVYIMTHPPPLSLGAELPHCFTGQTQRPSRRATFSKTTQGKVVMVLAVRAVPCLWTEIYTANNPSPARLKRDALLGKGMFEISFMLSFPDQGRLP